MVPTTGAVEGLAGLVQPWASFYSDHRWLQTTLIFVHLSGIFLGGGFAIAADRDTFIAMQNARLSGQIRHLGRSAAFTNRSCSDWPSRWGAGFSSFWLT
jgi:hypothetical protein